MKERPILFSAPMVKALLEGRKTQTRRIVKPAIELTKDHCHVRVRPDTDFVGSFQLSRCPHQSCVNGMGKPSWRERFILKCPYGTPGDRLWVKETFFSAIPYSYGTTQGGEEITPRGIQRTLVHYTADGDPANTPNKCYPQGLRHGFAAPDPYAVWRKKSSLHMPRWASRITLEITDVRVQRVEEISGEDAEAEGVTPVPVRPIGGGLVPDESYREGFLRLFYDINKRAKRGENPWVWALTFKVVKP